MGPRAMLAASVAWRAGSFSRPVCRREVSCESGNYCQLTSMHRLTLFETVLFCQEGAGAIATHRMISSRCRKAIDSSSFELWSLVSPFHRRSLHCTLLAALPSARDHTQIAPTNRLPPVLRPLQYPLANTAPPSIH